MASSDDEGETLDSVSDYEFLSGDNESISFAELPLEYNEGETRIGKPQEIFLSGKTDNGLRKIYKRVIAWKFDLPSEKPEISVLSQEGHWIKLLKPWKPFLDIIRTIQVTLHLLHFVKWNPQRSEKALWDHLNKTFRMFERRPSKDDLADQVPLITEVIKRDEKLANSKILSTFLAEKPWERKISDEDVKPPFIVDDVDEEDQEEPHNTNENGDDEPDEDDCYDHMCAICDNGGDVIICEGKCMRSFHATPEGGDDSNCESLGLTDAELRAIENVDFYCENCKYKKHQCFACGKLGSSDESSCPEVFCCVNGACGFFYHPYCVAKLLHPGDSAAAEKIQQRIAAGEQFACPAHRCHVCNEVEVKSIKELQFAVCRRCPRAYHRKCLPREITTEEDEERGIIRRAWEELIPNRILIYCLDHEIDPDISTPVRDHVKFPAPSQDRKKKLQSESSKKENLVKERGLASKDNAGNRISAKPPKGVDKVSSSLARGGRSRKRVEKFPIQASSKKQKVVTNRNSLGKFNESKTDVGETSLGDNLYATFYGTDSEQEKSGSPGAISGEHEIIQKDKPQAKRMDNSLTLDADERKRILDLMKEASSSVTLDQVKERHKSPSTHAQYSKLSAESITVGKAEGSAQAVRAALKKLDEGGRIQDAKAVCGVDLLFQVLRWRERLKVYLAPFLYGMRYTSYGRHFTKVDKLKEIVKLLHCYVQDGDMLVDFCCGSNDFSCLMKKKLDETGKRCSFKNYDILQAKNDFNFERRDWMEVQPAELPGGSQLIMGLNPPFGVNAALANKFINKALEFKPKLLILIVPRETQRLDEMESPYDLIWEDDQMFVGKSFYLPGSVDKNDKQIEDWNLNAPVLYLWSCPDWTPKHRAIAEQHGHLSGALKYRLDESHNEMHVPTSAQDCHNLDKSFVKQGEDVCADTPETLEQKGRVTRRHQEGLLSDNNGSEGGKNHALAKNHSDSNSKKFDGKRKKKRQSNNIPEEKSSGKHTVSRHLSPNVSDLLHTYSPKHLEIPSQVHHERGDYQQFSQRNFSIYQPYSQTGYTGDQETDDLVRKYSLNSGEPYRGMTTTQAYAPSRNPDYGFRASADRWMGSLDGRANSVAFRSFGEMNEYYERDAIFQSHVNVHPGEEPNSWSQRTAYPAYHGPGFRSPYGQLNPAASSTYGEMNTSAMQRYAPRLDQLHHARMTSAPPHQDTSGIHHPPAPQPAFQGSLGFASGRYHSYSQHESSGWLNE